MNKNDKKDYDKNGGKAFIVVPLIFFIGYILYVYFS